MNTLTNQEAIEILEGYLFCLCEDGQTCPYCEARDLAINALKDKEMSAEQLGIESYQRKIAVIRAENEQLKKENDRDCESCSEISMLGRENEQVKKELHEERNSVVLLHQNNKKLLDYIWELKEKLDNLEGKNT